MNFKSKLEDYSESDFLSLVEEIYSGKGTDEHQEQLLEHLLTMTKHPEGSDIIFYPPDDREDSPEGVISTIKQWRKSQGLPCFKDS